MLVKLLDMLAMKFALRMLLSIALVLLSGSAIFLLLECIGFGLPRKTLFIVNVPAFLISIPAVLIGRKLTESYTEREARKTGMRLQLRGCPSWVEKALKIDGWLVMIVFVAVMFMSKNLRDAAMARFVFPLYAMSFSGYAAAVAYSALHIDNSPRFCANGHEVSASHAFCPKCGSPAIVEAAK